MLPKSCQNRKRRFCENERLACTPCSFSRIRAIKIVQKILKKTSKKTTGFSSETKSENTSKKHQKNIKKHLKTIKKTTLKKQRKNNQKIDPQGPVLAWEREARLHGARVAYVTRAARSFNRFTFSSKSPEIPQRTARRSISHTVDRSANSLAALARSLRSLDGGIGH